MIPVIASFLPLSHPEEYLPAVFAIWEAFNSKMVDDYEYVFDESQTIKFVTEFDLIIRFPVVGTCGICDARALTDLTGLGSFRFLWALGRLIILIVRHEFMLAVMQQGFTNGLHCCSYRPQ